MLDTSVPLHTVGAAAVSMALIRDPVPGVAEVRHP